MKYEEKKLSELVDTISDTRKIDKDKVVLVNTSDVLAGEVLNHTYTENCNLRGQFKKRFKTDDILYSEIRPANKRFAYIDFDSEDYIASTKLMVLRRKSDKITNKYLYYCLTNDLFVDRMQHLAEARSGTFPQITFDVLKGETIYLPSIANQNKITSILDNINNKIRLNNEINNNLSDQIRSIYKEIFIQYDDYKRLDEISNVTIGKTPPRSEHECFTTDKKDIKWISIGDLGKSGMFIFETSEKLTKEAVEKYNVKVIPKDTVILSFKLTVGRTAFTTEDMTTNEAIAHFNLNNKELNNYLYCYLTYFNYSDLGSTSSIATAINSKIVKTIMIGIPSEEQLNRFNKLTSSMFELIKSNEKENIKLSQLRDTLLPKLMNDEIDLDNIEI